MHGAGQFTAVIHLLKGGTLALLPAPKFDADLALDEVKRIGAKGIFIVGDAFALPLRQHGQRAKAQHRKIFPAVTVNHCAGIHDVADDFPFGFRNEIQLRHKTAAFTQYMRQIVLVTPRDVVIPKRFAREMLHRAVILRLFQPNRNLFHIVSYFTICGCVAPEENSTGLHCCCALFQRW